VKSTRPIWMVEVSLEADFPALSCYKILDFYLSNGRNYLRSKILNGNFHVKVVFCVYSCGTKSTCSIWTNEAPLERGWSRLSHSLITDL